MPGFDCESRPLFWDGQVCRRRTRLDRAGQKRVDRVSEAPMTSFGRKSLKPSRNEGAPWSCTNQDVDFVWAQSARGTESFVLKMTPGHCLQPASTFLSPSHSF